MDSSLDGIWDAPVEHAPRKSDVPLFLASDDEQDRMPDAPPRGTADPIEDLFAGVADIPDSPELPSHPILTSSPAHHLDDNGDAKDKDVKKPKKKAMRLDEGRLLGDSGFPQLIQDTKTLKIKGKGHEARVYPCVNRCQDNI
jgi:replication fork protection complex subunit Csm3/Swi3